MNTSLIGIAGDWHGNTPWAVARLNDLAERGVDIILHLGDFGIWGDEAGLSYLTAVNSILGTNNQKILVTLGNHENYVMVGALQVITDGDFEGWMVNPELPNILYAQRGQRWIWEGVSFVSLGGANSIDRYGRTEGINWWGEEQISYGDVYRTVEGGHADIFISHDCPEGVNLFGTHRDNCGDSGNRWSEDALEYAQHSRVSLRAAVDAVQPDLLFHGHHHHYIDQVTDLIDGEGNGYSIHTIGLNKDDDPDNIGVLELPAKKFTIL